jgi:hypothetical protein
VLHLNRTSLDRVQSPVGAVREPPLQWRAIGRLQQ